MAAEKTIRIAAAVSRHLFARNVFSVRDYGKPPVLFFLDFLAILGLYVFIACYGLKLPDRGNRASAKEITDTMRETQKT
ncbi:hypothetical protein [Breznakiella homolactica]|uniref:Uncharacterized protein n=1 Tax=Breznakiella homolactica TaxID=2798577 RepID=A0A7T7XLR5_9SPIR|nr:hypothetical protein [Breznakiella homolactica]QQO08715.1 hypothetical protein JFL75_17580 [Breznakiella homolactica]